MPGSGPLGIWMLRSPQRRDNLPAPPLTRVLEGLQGVQVVLCGSLVVPKPAAGIRQVTEALPLRPPVP